MEQARSKEQVNFEAVVEEERQRLYPLFKDVYMEDLTPTQKQLVRKNIVLTCKLLHLDDRNNIDVALQPEAKRLELEMLARASAIQVTDPDSRKVVEISRWELQNSSWPPGPEDFDEAERNLVHTLAEEDRLLGELAQRLPQPPC